MFKKILIPILGICQFAYSEVTFITISGKPDLVISLSKGELENILRECKDIAIKTYDCQGEYSVWLKQGGTKGLSYTLTETGERKSFNADAPNQIFISIKKVMKSEPYILMKGSGWFYFFLDKTNTSVEAHSGYKQRAINSTN